VRLFIPQDINAALTGLMGAVMPARFISFILGMSAHDLGRQRISSPAAQLLLDSQCAVLNAKSCAAAWLSSIVLFRACLFAGDSLYYDSAAVCKIFEKKKQLAVST
jgi:hypothetical protein